jgi:hypothetical protein
MRFADPEGYSLSHRSSWGAIPLGGRGSRRVHKPIRHRHTEHQQGSTEEGTVWKEGCQEDADHGEADASHEREEWYPVALFHGDEGDQACAQTERHARKMPQHPQPVQQSVDQTGEALNVRRGDSWRAEQCRREADKHQSGQHAPGSRGHRLPLGGVIS